jgi:hypothetical protein
MITEKECRRQFTVIINKCISNENEIYQSHVTTKMIALWHHHQLKNNL